MKNQNLKTTLLILFTSVVCFTFCTKKAFTNVELHGRVVNFATKAPIIAKVVLWGEERPANNGAISLATTQSSADGTFYLKGSSVKNNEYTLQIFPPQSDEVEKQVSLEDGHNIDVGDFLFGSYTFYCKVNLVSVSGSAIDFDYLPNGLPTHFNAGTNTTFVTSQAMSAEAYQALGPNFHIGYKTYPNGVEADSSIFVHINLPPDTLYRTINY